MSWSERTAVQDVDRLQAALQVLQAVIEIDVQVPLPGSGTLGIVFQRFGPALQFCGLALQFVNLHRQLDQAAAGDDPLERGETPFDIGKLDRYGILPRLHHFARRAEKKRHGYRQ